MNRKIIFLDIDGTLSMENRVPQSAKRACRAARKNGHLLYVCTGRARLQVSTAIIRIGFDGIVSSGGAYIETSANTHGTSAGSVLGVNGGKLLFSAAIEPEKLRALTAYFNGRKAAYTLELTDRLIAGPYLKSYFSEYYAGRPFTFGSLLERLFLRQIFSACERYDDNFDFGDVRKVVFWESGGLKFEDMAREFGAEYEFFRLSIPVAGMSGGEIGPLGVHKGLALEKVAAYHGFERSDTIAFGDSDNDRAMIQSAGLGVAMGNAVDSLKAIADDVTDSIENDGLAKAFKKYALI
ncbi:MAG: Cof-type HAD-IIB family hydrolase [Spirochaetaceae bacterium]|nr:Cof-type HAD-IIB family hydrolase [Spirochaetaceae bacterium]